MCCIQQSDPSFFSRFFRLIQMPGQPQPRRGAGPRQQRGQPQSQGGRGGPQGRGMPQQPQQQQVSAPRGSGVGGRDGQGQWVA